jgi:N-methylhydantoinase B
MTDTNGRKWDGSVLPYRPADDYRIDRYVATHSDAAEDLDPITFEVIRHALWNVNEEHSLAIITVSPSPVAAIVHDLNCAILTDEAEYVYFAPYLQHLNAAADSAIKWTCEYRAEAMGIRDGDVFLNNDPWIGSNHQQDVCMFSPVMVDGKVFAWVTNSLHHYDLGGTTPGSFCPDATSVFVEPNPCPPIKIVDSGIMRPDVEHMFARRSRVPQMVALDLRSQLAGINVARSRVLGMIEDYGAATVKAVMRKVIDDGERAFVEKLRQIPDGTWSELVYQESASVGDRGVHPVQLHITKEGDELVFSNAGTGDAAGALNTSFVGWKGAITAGIIPLLTYDQHFAIGGGLRHVRFDPVPGTITCASWPSPTSSGPATAVHLTMKQSTQALNRMLLTSPELEEEMLTWGSVSQWPLVSIEGQTRDGEYFGSSLLEPMIGGTGARRHADGVDSGGHTWDPKSSGANAEENELFYPMLYLSREELIDSGGAGQYRGGNTVVSRFIAHGNDGINHSLTSSAQESCATTGVAGANPGAPNRIRLARGTNVLALMADGRMPTTFADAGGEVELIPTKARNFFQAPGDVYELIYTGGTGLGDPLDRDPQAVATDVSEDCTSPAAAHAYYGVVLEQAGPYDWRVDTDATERTRQERRDARRALPVFDGGSPEGGRVPDGRAFTRILLNLAVAEHEGRDVCFCTQCRAVVCDASDNYKSRSRFEELELPQVNGYFIPPKTFLDTGFVARRYFCPGCTALFDLEACMPGAEPFRDVSLVLAQAPARQETVA